MSKYDASDFDYNDDFDICANNSPEVLGNGSFLASISNPVDEISSPVTSLPPTKTRGRKSSRKSTDSQTSVKKVDPNEDQDYAPPTRESKAKSRRGKKKNSLDLVVTSQLLDENNVPVPNDPPLRRSPRKAQKGRARRVFMSEQASRGNLIDSIDLSNTPKVNIITHINLGCSSTESDSEIEISSTNKNLEQDLTNPEINIKIKWLGGIESFKLRKFQKFESVMKILANREKTHINCISLNLKDKIINKDDTPDSVNYKFMDFIEGRVLKSKIIVAQTKDLNNIELKVQSDKWKKPLLVNIKKDQSFKILCIKLVEELGGAYTAKDFKLRFDGEFLSLTETPEDNDFEGGECLDLVFNKK